MFLTDVARYKGVDYLGDKYKITADEPDAVAKWEGVEIKPGDAILIRTGFMKHWSDKIRKAGGALRWGATTDGERVVRIAEQLLVNCFVILALQGRGVVKYWTMAWVRASMVYSEGSRLTDNPFSLAVWAVMGPMQATATFPIHS